ncbi:iron-sulfur cluster biosynthesis family protein [Paenibacillus mendelii]|uniref:Iron-sulfur cluster biosynthesis family protein n=1 Tax=Paenibacillus mendelii TaxID=206163 RepID=A0ABV6J5D5_9BACL|nr:iron-sulfur cluster biosynthesis family protein [Paenibacillus mendelii]MCQ6560202.1 iron-sulfur cluster biosynthesis family protein [Paenibacillus mendelii]
MMHFTFTPAAVEQLSGYLKDGERSLKLLYDTEGCGCVVSGVPALQLIQAPDQDDRQGAGDPYGVWYEPRYEVFFEPRLKIDFDRTRHTFSLKSDNQIYTVHMRLLT